MSHLDRDRAEDTYLAAVDRKERAEILVVEARKDYDASQDVLERLALCIAWIDSLTVVSMAEQNVAEAWAMWQDLEIAMVLR